jgi:hypothetical protein
MPQTPTDRDLILQAMVSLAAADGDLHDDELATISTVYEQITGDKVSVDDIKSVSGGDGSDSSTFIDKLAQERDQLSKEMKEFILSSAYMVLLADGRVAARERKTLMDFAKALKISEIHRSIIFENVERRIN